MALLALLMRSCVTQTLLRVRCTRAITTHVSGKMHACAVRFVSPVKVEAKAELQGLALPDFSHARGRIHRAGSVDGFIETGQGGFFVLAAVRH